MTAAEEAKRLAEKIASGELPPDEPLFVFRARDCYAARAVRYWLGMLRDARKEIDGDEAIDTRAIDGKLVEGEEQADRMMAWPIKQVPGLPGSRVNVHDLDITVMKDKR